jgi:hypothetical protein
VLLFFVRLDGEGAKRCAAVGCLRKRSNVGRLCDRVWLILLCNGIGSFILVAYVMTSCPHSEQGCKLRYISKNSKGPALLETLRSLHCHHVSVSPGCFYRSQFLDSQNSALQALTRASNSCGVDLSCHCKVSLQRLGIRSCQAKLG